MLTLAEGGRPTSNTDAEALAMSEEEDRLIEDALYFSEPDIIQGSSVEPVASPTRSNSSVVSPPSRPYIVAPVFLLITVFLALIHSRRAGALLRQRRGLLPNERERLRSSSAVVFISRPSLSSRSP
jgi:hypothetical protein